jgi:hypothetical protein
MFSQILESCAQAASPRSVRAAFTSVLTGRVVAGQNDNRILRDASLADGVKDAADVVVHLQLDVGVRARIRLAFEIRMWKKRWVDLSQRGVDKERPTCSRLRFHERRSFFDNLSVEQRSRCEIKRLHFF